MTPPKTSSTTLFMGINSYKLLPVLLFISLTYPLSALEENGIVNNINIVREYVEAEGISKLDVLRAEFGLNKELPKQYELQILLALSHYPELRETKIHFIVDDVSIPLSSRPLWTSSMRSARQRTYLVVIDTEREGTREALLLKNQPFNAQVGIIGHELAHTVYYLDRSFFGIIGDAICQLSDCRLQFERKTDLRLIDYGLGWQRYDHALFVRGSTPLGISAAMNTEAGGGAYMSPAEILARLQSHASYAVEPKGRH